LDNDEVKDKNNMNFLQSAKDRAKYTYQILQKLSKAENEIVVADLLEFGSSREDVSSRLFLLTMNLLTAMRRTDE